RGSSTTATWRWRSRGSAPLATCGSCSRADPPAAALPPRSARSRGSRRTCATSRPAGPGGIEAMVEGRERVRSFAHDLIDSLSDEEVRLLIAYAHQLQEGHFAALVQGLEDLLEESA